MRYAYGIVRAAHPTPHCDGIGSPPHEVTVVSADGLGVAVSEVDEGTVLEEAEARRHLDVLVRLLEDGPVLPVRMGTVADSDDDIRTVLLDPVASIAPAQLDALDGLVELHVDADDDEHALLAQIAATNPAAPRRRLDLAATIDEGRRIGEALVAARRETAHRILLRLRPHAVDDVARALINGPEDPLLRWAFLVRKSELAAFDAAVMDLRQEFPSLYFSYVGPLPAVHFLERTAPVSVDAGADAFAGSGRWDW